MKIQYYKDWGVDIQVGHFQLCILLKVKDWCISWETVRFTTFPWWYFWWYLNVGPIFASFD